MSTLMLLKFHLNYRRQIKHLLASTLLLLPLLLLNIQAQGFNDTIQIHGFIAQGAIDVDGSNYVNDDQSASLELTEIGLNASFQYSDTLRFAGQAVYLDGGNRYADGLHVDYLLMDWSFLSNENWQANLYLGRIKNYHWLYSSARDVPMTRPSILLPQSVYFDATRNMSVGGDGAAVTFKYFDDNFGDFDFNLSSSMSPISDEQTDILMGQFSNGDLEHEEDLQVSLYWQPQLSLWRFGFAMTDAEFEYEKEGVSLFSDGEISLTRFYFNGEYQLDSVGFSFELLQEKMEIDGLLDTEFERDTTGQGGFIQLEYQHPNQMKLLARLEHYYADKDDKSGRKLEESTYGFVPKYFGYQHEAVVGLSYNMSANTQIQLEHHWVKGTARLTPVVLPEPSSNKQEYWQMAAVQFIYWF